MILVDTSVWVEILRGRSRDRFAEATAGDIVVSCLPVMQEVLQGFDIDAAYHVAVAAFADIAILEDPLTRPVFDDAISDLPRRAQGSDHDSLDD